MKTFYTFLFLLPTLLFGESYWQQHVHYTINATLDAKEHKILGKETLVYTNNSPDTLHYILYRLYWNLFTKNSRGHILGDHYKNYDDADDGGITVNKFSIIENDNELSPPYSIDNTLMKINLPSPIPPGGKTTFSVEWTENIPADYERTGHEGRDYNIAQWYPQIATYDKYGWDQDQYLGPAEFHNEFGTFDVNITLPKSFTMGFTGELTNPEEVYPESIRTKLHDAEWKSETQHIADYSNAKWDNGEDSTPVTWKFHAENVRDFAWCAYEHYIWDVSHYAPNDGAQPVTIHALYQADKAEYWKNVAEYGRHAITFYSEHFGRYAYKNCFAVEGPVGGGMEYPGITFIGHYGDKNSHSPFGVVVHEIGHNWYPMMIGSNEEDYAFMDEGFNTFITSLATEAYYGRYDNSYVWTEWYQKLFAFPNDEVRSEIQRGSLYLAKTDYEEPIATHVYRFTQLHYGTSIYSKTAAVMYMLQYVLGDSVFESAMKEYYNRWKFKHPYPEDFYQTMQEASGRRDLRWFFDEWFNRTYTCDYGICSLNSQPVTKEDITTYKTSFHISRKGQAIMPLDVQFQLENGNKQTVWIPVDKWFNAEFDLDTTVELPSKALRAEINPDGRIMDIDRLNNTTGLPKIKVSFDNTIMNIIPIDAYQIRWRPSLWYTDEGGVNLGYKLTGSYMDDMQRFTLYHLYNTRLQNLDYDLALSNNLYKISALTSFDGRAYLLEGRRGYAFQLNKGFRKNYTVQPYHNISLLYSYSKVTNPDYLLYPQSWDAGRLGRLAVGYTYTNRGENWNVNASANLEGSSSLFGETDFQYSKRTFEVKGNYNLPDGSSIGIRFFTGNGYGNIPNQAKYYLGGASPIEEFNMPFFRSKGMLPSTIRNHAFAPGGGNMRGYYAGLVGGEKLDAMNLEWKWSSLLPFTRFKIPIADYVLKYFRSSVFVDIGRVCRSNEYITNQNFEVDFGVGLRLASLYGLIGQASQSNILAGLGLRTLRIDFPFFNSLPLPDENKFKFRWAISINEVF